MWEVGGASMFMKDKSSKFIIFPLPSLVTGLEFQTLYFNELIFLNGLWKK